MNKTTETALIARSKALEAGVKGFLEDVERREKTLTDMMDYKWKAIHNEDLSVGVAEKYVGDLHDYEIIMNEILLVKRELQKILEGEE